MQPDLILIPFAENAASGNIDDIPETLSPSDPPQAASWSVGFPPVTMTPLAAGGIPPRGQSFNGVLNAISQHIVYQGGGGQYTWSDEYVSEKGGYPKGAVIQSDDGTSSYRSAIDNNTVNFNTTPSSIGAQWMPWAGGSIGAQPDATTSVKGIVRLATNAESVSGSSSSIAVTPSGLSAAISAIPSSDKFNAAIATVAASENINLTTGAPSTSQIAISESGASIASFTVAANRCFIARFSGANTLVNSASLVTQNGADIQTAAGDTCIMRATAANVVEILCYVPAGGWANLLAPNGYQELPGGGPLGGLTIQWGVRAASGTSVVTFPDAFATACFSVVAAPGNGGGFPVVASKTTTGFTMTSSGTDNNWVALGR